MVVRWATAEDKDDLLQFILPAAANVFSIHIYLLPIVRKFLYVLLLIMHRDLLLASYVVSLLVVLIPKNINLQVLLLSICMRVLPNQICRPIGEQWPRLFEWAHSHLRMT